MTYTEDDIKCCEEVRLKDIPDDQILEAIERIVNFFNSGNWDSPSRRLLIEDAIKLPSIDYAFDWGAEGDFNYWERIYSADDRDVPLPKAPTRPRRKL